MSKPAPLSVRVTPDERSLLEAAARSARTNVSDFVRRKAIEAAELELMLNPPRTVIPAEDWEKFEAWLHSPPEDRPRLRELSRLKPVWET